MPPKKTPKKKGPQRTKEVAINAASADPVQSRSSDPTRS